MYYPYQRYCPEYLQALEQDLQKRVFKNLLSNLMINSVHPIERWKAKRFYDGVFGLLDMVDPPQTADGRALTYGANAYNLSKYL